MGDGQDFERFLLQESEWFLVQNLNRPQVDAGQGFPPPLQLLVVAGQEQNPSISKRLKAAAELCAQRLSLCERVKDIAGQNQVPGPVLFDCFKNFV